MRRDADWNDLRYFLHAARAKTLVGAARALRVEHSTVGRRLSVLERTLGAALVVRRPDGLRLTALGDQVMPLAAEIEKLVHTVQELATTRKSRVRLAVPTGFERLVYRRLNDFLRDEPGIALEFVIGNRPVDLKNGEADLALRVGPVVDQDLVARRVGEVGWSIYASDAYLSRHPAPIDSRDLAGHEILGYDAVIGAVPGARWIEAHGAGAAIVTRHREASDMLAAAIAGVGLAVLPCALADREPALKRLTRDVVGTSPVSLVYRREATLSEPMRRVIRFIVRIMKENAELISGAHPAEA